MDPVELRLKNIPAVSQGRDGSPPYTSTGLRECLVRGRRGVRLARGAASGPSRRATAPCAGASAWRPASGSPAAAGPPSTVIVKLFADGSVNLNMGASDIGTGTKTVMAMVVAEELGVEARAIQIEHADTGTTQFATASGGSKTVPTESPGGAGGGGRGQAAAARAGGRGTQGCRSTTLELRRAARSSTIATRRRRSGSRRSSGSRSAGVIVGVGYRGPNPEGKVVNPFAAQFCEVEVEHAHRRGADPALPRRPRQRPGHEPADLRQPGLRRHHDGHRLRHDRGAGARRGQTGKMCNRNWHDYKMPTALDVPPTIASVPIDLPDARGEHHRGEGARRAGDDPDGGGHRQRGRPRHRGAGDGDADHAGRG